MRAPDFWYSTTDESVAFVLRPLGWIYGFVGRARAKLVTPFRASVPVVCVGNVTAGGTGKTPLAIAIGERLKAKGLKVAFLSRGYGADIPGAMVVDPNEDTADDVGDEPLLLAQHAMTVVTPDRPAGARLAISRGAQIIVMDDGFQNPSLVKDLSFIVVDAAKGFGNGCIIPAGPLRERVEDALARAAAVITMGEGHVLLPVDKPLLRAHVVPLPSERERFKGKRVLAFAGIGEPKRFFATLEACGAIIEATRDYADHHVFTSDDLADLRETALRYDIELVTTEKDYLRLHPDDREGIDVLKVAAQFDADSSPLIDQFLEQCLKHYLPPGLTKH
jgi:tetraacyldisaccharide 4'-kinase